VTLTLKVGLWEQATICPLNAAKYKWLDEVTLIIFAPSERLVAYDSEVQEKLQESQRLASRLWPADRCADKMNVTGELEKISIKVVS
jgi:hypothetical protein